MCRQKFGRKLILFREKKTELTSRPWVLLRYPSVKNFRMPDTKLLLSAVPYETCWSGPSRKTSMWRPMRPRKKSKKSQDAPSLSEGGSVWFMSTRVLKQLKLRPFAALPNKVWRKTRTASLPTTTFSASSMKMPPAETLPSMRCISTRSAATFTIITTD